MLVYQGVYINLVGGFNHLEKYEFVNGKDDIPYIYIYIMENKTYLKPPTRNSINGVKVSYKYL